MEQKIPAGKILKEITQKFGDQEFSLKDLENFFEGSLELSKVRFENCHEDNFSFSELIDFFVSRGKLKKDGEKLSVEKNFKCGCSH